MTEHTLLFIVLDGFKWPARGFPPENFDQIRKMELREGDVVLCTYPKCGTNWTLYILWEILNEGLPPPQPKDLLAEQMPFVDRFGVSAFESINGSQRQLMTHVPIPYLPFKSSVKYVVTIRNPFDCCVSFYHFVKRFGEFFMAAPVTSFDQFYESFLSSDVLYGDFFDHLLSWYEKRNDPNVLLLVYEEMIRDRKKCVLDVARFLGEEHLKKMEGQTLEKVLEHTSFEYMKSQLDYGSLAKGDEEVDNTKKPEFKPEFMRKGIVGDWKNYFKEDQKLRLKVKMEAKMKGTKLLDYWLKTLEL